LALDELDEELELWAPQADRSSARQPTTKDLFMKVTGLFELSTEADLIGVSAPCPSDPSKIHFSLCAHYPDRAPVGLWGAPARGRPAHPAAPARAYGGNRRNAGPPAVPRSESLLRAPPWTGPAGRSSP